MSGRAAAAGATRERSISSRAGPAASAAAAEANDDSGRGVPVFTARGIKETKHTNNDNNNINNNNKRNRDGELYLKNVFFSSRAIYRRSVTTVAGAVAVDTRRFYTRTGGRSCRAATLFYLCANSRSEVRPISRRLARVRVN